MVLARLRLVPHHEVPALFAEHHGRVDMGVDDDRLLVDPRGARLRGLRRFFRRRLRAERDRRERRDNHEPRPFQHPFPT